MHGFMGAGASTRIWNGLPAFLRQPDVTVKLCETADHTFSFVYIVVRWVQMTLTFAYVLTYLLTYLRITSAAKEVNVFTLFAC